MSSAFRSGALAVISGGASGVGYAMAAICRRHGMHIALLDRNAQTLEAASKALPSSDSTQTLTYNIDVSDASAWKSVHSDLSSKFSSIDLLMLNAGTSYKPSSPHTSPWTDIDYFTKTLSTNLFGVINGLATFLPLVQQSTGPSAIIFTGSKQGITNPPGNPAYNASKSAIKTLAEQLSHDLRTPSSPVHHAQTSVHLLIPGWTFTGLSGNAGPVSDAEAKEKKPSGAWLPSQCAEYGYERIKQGKFYIVCPDNDVDEALDEARMTWAVGDVVEGRSALSRWDERYKEEASEWIGKEAGRRREGRGTKI